MILSAVIPLGMEDGSITNDQITASTFFEQFEPWDGRLNNPDGEWSTCKGDSTPWIQVKFSSAVNITAIQTQGSSVSTTQWVSELQIQTGDTEDSLSYINVRNNESAVYVSIPYLKWGLTINSRKWCLLTLHWCGRFFFFFFFVLFCFVFVLFCFCFVLFFFFLSYAFLSHFNRLLSSKVNSNFSSQI